MSQRQTKSLEAPVTVIRHSQTADDGVDMNYPQATELTLILIDVAKWSGEIFAMDPSLNRKVQIFAPYPLARKQAMDLLLASLSLVNLRAVRVAGVTKIVPTTGAIRA